MLASKYIAITDAVPQMSASGKLRCGWRISDETMLTLFHPSYAHSDLTSAAKNPSTVSGTSAEVRGNLHTATDFDSEIIE